MIIDYDESTIRALNEAVERNTNKVIKFKQDFIEIKRRLAALPDKARSAADVEVLVASRQLIAILDHMFFIGDEYRNIIGIDKSIVENVDENYYFTAYWKGGKRRVLYGPTIEIAYTRAGYTVKEASQIEWFDRGITNTHVFNPKKKIWELRK